MNQTVSKKIPEPWCTSIQDVLVKIAPHRGMRISFHHHLRMGDGVVKQVLDALTQYGVKDLTLCVSSVIGQACTSVLDAVRAGVVTRIETTGLKSPLSDVVLACELPEPVVFRSHGGRARAIRTGELPIDIAFMAASAADAEGNLNGVDGVNNFGSMGYAMVDAEYADTVVAVTDSFCEDGLTRVSIPGDRVDYVAVIDSIGDSGQMSGGTLRTVSGPVQQVIAARTMQVLETLSAIHNGLRYQAGSGAISLAVTNLVAEYMREHGIRGEFASGGITGPLTELLKQGLFTKLYDVQSFDAIAVQSLADNGAADNERHIEMSAGMYADPGVAGNIADQLDVMLLSATEAAVDFTVNSITGTNGRILGALGGAPDTAAGSKLTIVVLPSFRGRIPTIHERVRTVCTPEKDVDIIITERGICVNPRRDDLLRQLTDYPSAISEHLLTTEQLKKKIFSITGQPHYPEWDGKVVGIVEYRDGTVIDTVRMV